jgi:hypothetical protein
MWYYCIHLHNLQLTLQHQPSAWPQHVEWYKNRYQHDNIKIPISVKFSRLSYTAVVKSKPLYDRRSVGLGVLPLLEQVTRCYIYLSDNYFLNFSCRAPFLKRRRVCKLQCNEAGSISSYITTDGLLASSSWCRLPNGAHNQILISLFDSYFVFSV